MIQNLIRCNMCAIRNCTQWYTDRKGENICRLNDTQNCTSFVSYDSFKRPILMHLMVNQKAQGALNVLAKYGLAVREIEEYPHFRLRVKR